MVSITPKKNESALLLSANRRGSGGIMSTNRCCCLFVVVVVGVLVLDAYEYISVQVAKDARNTFYAKIKDVDPAIIEQQIGMKILSLEEYKKIVNETAATKEQHISLTSNAAVIKADLDVARQAIVQKETLVTSLVTERDAGKEKVTSMTLERDDLANRIATLNSEKETLAAQLVTITTERDSLAFQKQQQVNVDRVASFEKEDVNTQCILNDQSTPETIAAALFIHNCTLVKCVTTLLADQIMAYVPNYKYHKKIHDNNNVIVELLRDEEYTWLAMDWRQRQGIQFPYNNGQPLPCNPSTTLGRHLNYYFGSQLFTDMTLLLYSRRPYYRFLDSTQETGTHVYLSTLYTGDYPDESPSMKALRQCLKQHGADRTNAISCLFLPTTDCLLTTINDNDSTSTIPTANPEIHWSKAPEILSNELAYRPKETPLCGVVGKQQDGDAGDDDYKNECLRNQVGRAVPVSPILQRSIQPDISKMALFLAGRELEMAAPLRAAVDELLQAQMAVQPLTLPCVALHIRRGDKLPECDQGREVSCQFHKNWTDYSDIGFDFLKQLNPGGGSLFVMTDDAAFLQGKTVEAPYQVVGLAGTTAPDLANADGLRDLAILMASLELASRCDAVVGNSESEVFEAMLVLNCIRRGSCPSVHSMNGAATQAFATHVADGRASSVYIPPPPPPL